MRRLREAEGVASVSQALRRRFQPEPTPGCTAPTPHRGVCQSFGSLKTEEKTERQCGQSTRFAGLSVRQFMVGYPSDRNIQQDSTNHSTRFRFERRNLHKFV
jgi:hypothetical protein